MDGKAVTTEILGDLRRRLHLSQRALAKQSGVPQPTLSEIEAGRREPSISLLSRVTESVGYAVDIRLVVLDRFSAVATARAIRRALADVEADGERSEPDRDAALRSLLDFRDALRRSASNDQFQDLTRSPPELTGDHKWDAIIAAVVEDEAARRRTSSPRWTNDPRRFVKPFWHLTDIPEFRNWELRTAPAAFVRHGVLANATELGST
jgi:transcriptional regulator with XRE-family HTH domain